MSLLLLELLSTYPLPICLEVTYSFADGDMLKCSCSVEQPCPSLSTISALSEARGRENSIVDCHAL